MAEPRIAEDHNFEEILPVAAPPGAHHKLDDLKRVKLTVSADLGACNMLVRDVLELQRGSVVQLSKLAGEMTDIYVNGLPLARGEVVVIGDTLHVRIGEIAGQEKQGDTEDVSM
ncbi:MAG: FliM/FliN family flagellar motor switch protein [Candidatus Hydrogenedentes bacterium]|nr:FliM/FliN family flagellar motor switch protein [Candidatus Hydrogenedentota bacterium]